MTRYKVELLSVPVESVVDAASEEEAHWLALEGFRDDLKRAPTRVTEVDEEGVPVDARVRP